MFGSVETMKAMVEDGRAKEAKAKEWLKANGYTEDDPIGKLAYLFATYQTIIYWTNCGVDSEFREIRGINKHFGQCNFNEDDEAIELVSFEQAKQFVSPDLNTPNKFGYYVDMPRY